MKLLQSVQNKFNDLLHLFYPHTCIHCGSDGLQADQLICYHCHSNLPFTNFNAFANNPVEKTFRGRCNIHQGAAVFYFSKHSMIQNILFDLKYRNNQEAGLFLGRLMGAALRDSDRFEKPDLLVPVPLNEKRLKQRGYNQAEVLIHGMRERISVPYSDCALARNKFTETQTQKNRTSRWETMQTVFSVAEPETLRDKHIVIIDDVITTGATIEALVNTIHSQVPCRISVMSAAWTSQ